MGSEGLVDISAQVFESCVHRLFWNSHGDRVRDTSSNLCPKLAGDHCGPQPASMDAPCPFVGNARTHSHGTGAPAITFSQTITGHSRKLAGKQRRASADRASGLARTSPRPHHVGRGIRRVCGDGVGQAEAEEGQWSTPGAVPVEMHTRLDCRKALGIKSRQKLEKGSRCGLGVAPLRGRIFSTLLRCASSVIGTCLGAGGTPDALRQPWVVQLGRAAPLPFLKSGRLCMGHVRCDERCRRPWSQTRSSAQTCKPTPEANSSTRSSSPKPVAPRFHDNLGKAPHAFPHAWVPRHAPVFGTASCGGGGGGAPGRGLRHVTCSAALDRIPNALSADPDSKAAWKSKAQVSR